MSPKKLKIGIGQVALVMGDKDKNVQTLLRAVKEAAAASCDVVVLPECSLVGWTSPAGKKAAENVPGPFTRALSALACEHHMAIVTGMEERDGKNIYNTAVFIGKDGKILRKHRKINELDIGLKVYARGDSLGVFDFEGVKCGLDICADSWGAEITDALYLMGAKLIFSPSAWAVQAGKEQPNIDWISQTYRNRTQGKDLTIVTSDSVGKVTQGPWKGKILQGESLITEKGKTLLHGPRNKEDLLVYEIVLQKEAITWKP